jgi:hypothetical protein
LNVCRFCGYIFSVTMFTAYARLICMLAVSVMSVKHLPCNCITGSQVPADIHVDSVVLRDNRALPGPSAQITTIYTTVKLNVTIVHINMQLFNGDSDLVCKNFFT